MSDADRTTALADALFAVADPSSDSRRDERVGGDDAGQSDRREPRVVEIGIGERTEVAEALANRGALVLATDVVERSVPDPIGFRVDDLLEPDRELYCGADLVYALRMPPELHDAFARLATDVDVPAAFTTLGGDPATVPTRPEQLAGGETIHWVERLDDSGSQ